MALADFLAPRRARFGAAIWAVVLFTITSWPSPPEIPGLSSILHFDKYVHATLYGGEGFLLYFAVAWRGGPRFSWLRVLAIGGALAVCGVLDEVHQIWIPGRGLELSDMITDALGGLGGAFLGALVARRLAASRP